MLSTLLSAALWMPAHAGDVCTGTEQGATEVGSGTSEDPWQICTAEQLRDINFHPDGSFVLVDDIDLAGFYWTSLNGCAIFPTEGGFTGHFDGDGHVISNLRGDRDGLFDCINGGVVEDLVLRNIDVAGEWIGTGGLVGFADEAVIRDVSVSGAVTSTFATTGGVAGYVQASTLERVSFTGQVEGRNNVGGLFGTDYWSSVADAYAYGSVLGSRNVGGLIGSANGSFDDARIDRCHAATIVREDGTSSSPQVGSAIGIANFSVVFGAADGSGQDASVVFDSADHPLIGLTLTTTELSGTALAVPRAAFLDPETYARAGWDLDRVWVAPTETSVPTLR